jgi:hypothetical protein
MIVLAAFLLLSFFGAVLRLIPKLLFRSAVRIPSTVPREWVEDYRAGNL